MKIRRLKALPHVQGGEGPRRAPRASIGRRQAAARPACLGREDRGRHLARHNLNHHLRGHEIKQALLAPRATEPDVQAAGNVPTGDLVRSPLR